MDIKIGEGSIYTDKDFTVAPAFTLDEDVKVWRSLAGRKFRSITVTLDKAESLAHEHNKTHYKPSEE